MTEERQATVLTGATGFLGRELLGALLARPGERIVLPVRPGRGQTAETRVTELLAALFPEPAARAEAARRVRAVETDLAVNDADLAPALLRATGDLPTRVIHGAASVAFDLPLAEARRINVDGTERVLAAAEALAREGRLQRFVYVSTAFVAGMREGVVRADEMDVGQAFTNTYERSKLEAEHRVRAGSAPWTVLRPSIVAGRATTGETSHFRVLYWPLKVLARGLVVCIPGERDAVFDIVPVDFVVDALLHVVERPDSLLRSYHLCAGSQVTLEQMVDLTAELFGMRRVPPYVSPRRVYPVLRRLLGLVLIGRFRRVIELGDVYVPYLSKRLVFDVGSTQDALAGSGVRMPDPMAYLKTILDYAKATDFGRRPAA